MSLAATAEAGEILYYTDWTMATMPGEIRLVAGGPTDDADGDGLVNGFEFLWDLDPMVGDPGGYAQVRFLPGPPRMEVSVPLSAAGREGIELGLLASSDLQAWSGTAFTESSVDQQRILSVPVSSDNPNFLRPQVIVTALDNPAGPVFFTLQAENESWSSGAVETEWAGFTGAGYVNTTNATGEWVEFKVSLLQPGTYRVDLLYALGGTGDRPHVISVNGQDAGTFTPSATEWTDWRIHSMNLAFHEGLNTLRVTGTTSGGVTNIDRLDVFAPQGPVWVQLTTSSFGPGSITVDPASPDGLYLQSSTVILTAVPDEDAVFEGWSGDVISSESSIGVVLDQDVSVQALFSADSGNYVPDFGLYGWATEAGGTTGGAGGTEITVTTLDALKAALTSDATQIIYISGTITGDGSPIRVHSNKSILG
ncbi:MAG TPA: hypothetical protein VK995_01515, partial [Oceanipulchritudo sp.]|nr:hypothetical protein [Oceanipulchritudo sp.]